MIKIVDKSGKTNVVTRGAYNSFYKPLGYEIVEEKNVITEEVKDYENKEKNVEKSIPTNRRK